MKHVDARKKSVMPPKKLSKGLKRHLKRLKAKPSPRRSDEKKKLKWQPAKRLFARGWMP
jgi:hypothetical protein